MQMGILFDMVLQQQAEQEKGHQGASSAPAGDSREHAGAFADDRRGDVRASAGSEE